MAQKGSGRLRKAQVKKSRENQRSRDNSGTLRKAQVKKRSRENQRSRENPKERNNGIQISGEAKRSAMRSAADLVGKYLANKLNGALPGSQIPTWRVIMS